MHQSQWHIYFSANVHRYHFTIATLASADISRHRVSVCLSACLSQAVTIPKRLNVGSRKRRHVIAQGL